MAANKLTPPTRALSLKGIALEYAALALGLAMIFTRGNTALWASVPVIGQFHLYENFSNFAISLMLMLGAGIFPILQRRFKVLAYVAAGLIIANIVMESSINTLNVRDMGDAYAGILGVIFGVGFLALILRFGIRQGTAIQES